MNLKSVLKNTMIILLALLFIPLAGPGITDAAGPGIADATGPGIADAAGPAVKPNIVFIFADDWGWGDLSCHGHPWLNTPNLDRLASQGIDFQQFNVLNPVCSPSRVAVMTGQYPARFCIHQHFADPKKNHDRGMPDWLDPKAPTLPRLLKQVGYHTAHFGKWHLTNRKTWGAPKPEAYGYDEVSVFNGGYSIGQTGGLRRRKRSLFEGGVRTPFLVRWPGHTPAGVKNKSTVFTAVDLLPTLCAAAGVTLPVGYRGDGENLLAALNGKSVTRTRPIFWEWLGNKTEPDWWPRLAARDGDWKLVMTGDGKRVELHQLLEDRAESKDMAKEHPDIVARLTKLALDWKATLPTKPNPECLTQVSDPVRHNPSKTGAKGSAVTPEVRARAFARWDTNMDNILTLDEYRAGLKGQKNLGRRFLNFDKNGDGKLTREEFVGKRAK